MKKKITNRTNYHLQLTGEAMVDGGGQYVMFTPANPVKGIVQPRRTHGTGLLLSDGTFDYVAQTRDHHSQATLIRKLPYGRLSKTKPGKIQHTLVLDHDDPESAWHLLTNSIIAAFALQDYLPACKRLPRFIDISPLASDKQNARHQELNSKF